MTRGATLIQWNISILQQDNGFGRTAIQDNGFGRTAINSPSEMDSQNMKHRFTLAICSLKLQ